VEEAGKMLDAYSKSILTTDFQRCADLSMIIPVEKIQ
jgi:hypothetical protein